MTLAPTQIPIVLTATIVPNAVGGPAANPAQRRAEYLAAVAFYRQLAPVFFLENSTHALESDPAFQPADGFHVRHFPPSAHPERGKGFQEFEMLDAWVAGENQLPARWLKITGRYLIHNVAALLTECARRPPGCRLLMDQLGRIQSARTYLFFVETSYYRDHFAGLYRHCDDRHDERIERVVFRALREDPTRPFASFATQPQISAVAGSSGYRMQPGGLAHLVKTCLRRANRAFDRRYLWYQRTGRTSGSGRDSTS